MSRNDRQRAEELPFSGDFSNTSTSEEPFFVEIEDNSPSPSPPPAADSEQPPAWFRGPASREQSPPPQKPVPPPPPPRPVDPQTRQKPRGRQTPVVAVPGDESEEERTWQEKFMGWMLGEGGAGYGVSVVVHVILLLVMSLWILSTPKNEDLVTTLEETEVVDVASIQDVEIEELDTDFEPQVNDPLFDPAPLSAPDIGIGSLASSLVSPQAGGVDFKIPKQAVTKGSFTVWTEPEDPMPGQKYEIMIQIKLNDSVKRYPRRDLSGSIVGTDGYKDYFGGPTEAGYLPIKENTVLYQALTVPGAVQLVKDIINVESKILKEKQTIELVF